MDLLITSELRHIVYSFLDQNLLSNALFFATQLQAHDVSADSSQLLSLCYFRLNQFRAAFDASERFGKSGRHLGCGYIHAQCCLALGRYKDGLIALESCRHAWSENESWGNIEYTHAELQRQNAPDLAAIKCLLGKLYQSNNNSQDATEAYSAALKLNPFMWDAFTGLCELGVTMQVKNVFKVSSEMLGKMSRPLDDVDLAAQEPTVYQPRQHNTSKPKNPGRSFANSDPFAHLNPFGESTKHNSQGHFGIIDLQLKKPTPHEPVQSVRWYRPEVSPERPFLEPEPTLQDAMMDAATRPAFALSRSPESLRGRISSSSYEVNDDPLQTTLEPSKSNRLALSPGGDRTIPRSDGLDDPFVDRKRAAPGLVPLEKGNTVGARRSVRLKTQHKPSNTLSSSPTSSSSTSASSTNINDGRQLRLPKARVLKRLSTTSFTSFTTRKICDVETKAPRLGLATGPSKVMIPQTEDGPLEIPDKHQALNWLLTLVGNLGHGHYSLRRFDCQTALRVFKSLPTAQQETHTVLLQMARVLFEQAKYSEAVKFFKRARTVAPSNMEGMDMFSSALWHLKSDLDLALLSHELIELDRLSPETWCAMGNSFSLQHDYENAIRSFKRATQLDPEFAYAYTLEGHEHLANEDYAEAAHAFRKGVAVKRRHYNAWYGLAIVSQKLGRYHAAEQHFRIAFRIHPQNSVLAGCIGMALYNREEYAEALEYYKKACVLSPESTHARERKADVLLKLGDLDNAAEELFALTQLAPQKAHIYVLLGRMYRMRGENGKALQNFMIALSLNPQASSSIKEDMEAIKARKVDEVVM